MPDATTPLPLTMPERLVGRVQSGEKDASRWLLKFNAAYCQKTGMAIFPGSLNLLLPAPFDWYALCHAPNRIFFAGHSFGSERDVLLLPCVLSNLQNHRAFLWSTTTAARARGDASVIEIISDVKLRDRYSLSDGTEVVVEL